MKTRNDISNAAATTTDTPAEKPSKTSNPSGRTHIAIPRKLKDRLDRIAAAMLQAHARGATARVEPCEQGKRGEWITAADVIRIALDDYEAHQQRSRRKRVNTPPTAENETPIE